MYPVLLACQVGLIVGDSGSLCCCVPWLSSVISLLFVVFDNVSDRIERLRPCPTAAAGSEIRGEARINSGRPALLNA